MGFVVYTIIFFVLVLILTGLTLLFASIPLVYVFGIMLAILEIIYVCYVFYKILVSKILLDFSVSILYFAFICGVIPGILMILIIYICRGMLLHGREEIRKELPKDR